MRSGKGLKKDSHDGSNWLNEKKNEMYKLCDKLSNLMKFKVRLMAKLTNYISELDDAAKLCSGRANKPKKRKKIIIKTLQCIFMFGISI